MSRLDKISISQKGQAKVRIIIIISLWIINRVGDFLVQLVAASGERELGNRNSGFWQWKVV